MKRAITAKKNLPNRKRKMIKLMLSQLQNNMKSKVSKKHNNLPVQMFKNVQ